jgi:single-stranded DNA-binding protein
MPALNRVQLIGRLGKGPEGKYTPTGKKVIHFSVAVSERNIPSGSMSKLGGDLEKSVRSISEKEAWFTSKDV